MLITDADVTITDADAGDMIEGATITISRAVGGRPARPRRVTGGFVVDRLGHRHDHA